MTHAYSIYKCRRVVLRVVSVTVIVIRSLSNTNENIVIIAADVVYT